MDKPAPKAVRLQDYRPPGYLVDSVHLDIALEPAATRVRSRLALRRNPAVRRAGRSLALDGQQIELEAVRINGRPLTAGEYERSDRHLIVHRPPDQPFELETQTLCNPEGNAALSGLFLTRGIYCTQCEPEGFRRITYFPDRPDVLSVYTVRLEAPREAAPVLLANGNPVGAGDLGNGRHFALWHDPYPKPSYLFAAVGGELACLRDSFTTASGRPVELRLYVEPGREERCRWAMQSLKRAMAWDEQRFGREYDLDVFMIVAVSDFNMGAMENKGLNIFNDKLVLADPDTATDADYAAIEAVIAHEYFHNWSGNRVTCRDWFQLCLKEGLTVFRDQEFTADRRSGPVKRISDVRLLRTHQFPEDAGPLAHPVRPDSYIEINNFYTATVYEKGAELCRMLQTLVGRDGFRRGLDLYFARHDGQAVTVEDFLAAIADATGADLTQFALWYSQSGTPELAFSADYDRAAEAFTLTVSQVAPPTPGQARKRPLHIPLAIGLLGPKGEEMPLRLSTGEVPPGGVLSLRQREQVFRFEGVAVRPVPSLLRGFSAPVKVATALDERDLEFLMAHDGDLYNRWQAGQTIATRLLIDMVAAVRAGRTPPSGESHAHRLLATLRDDALEPAYRAEVLKLPSESDIARELGRDVDPDAIHRARRRLEADIGRRLHAALEHIHVSLEDGHPYSPDAASAGRRALRNVALGLLAATGSAEDLARAEAQYRGAGNMTDRMAALAILNQIPGEARDAAFADFFDRWHHDHLVIDKWFMLQATAPLDDAPARVAELTAHPQFSLKAPNKVRALIGAFATLNPVGFNRADGTGYRLVADKALEIDAFNPQIAARLLAAFKSWRMLEEGRRAKARAVLEEVAGRGGLSRDSYEIVTKTLE